MPGPADLYTAAQELLTACSGAIDTAPAGSITYQAIWPGLPAFDCAPALFVHCGGPQVADTYPLQPPLQPMQRMVQTGMVNLVQFTVTVIRCVPTITQKQQGPVLPNAAEISASAAATMGDAWAIWNHLKNLHRAKLLFQTPSGRREFAFQPAVPVRTSGGVGGWEMPMLVELPGYNETLP